MGQLHSYNAQLYWKMGQLHSYNALPPLKKIIYIYPGGKESHGDCFINEMLPPTVQDKHSP